MSLSQPRRAKFQNCIFACAIKGQLLQCLQWSQENILHVSCRCDAGSKFGLLPYPALSSNTSQRLTTIKFFLNALGGDVSWIYWPCGFV